jgi:hypothetical protein
MKCCKICNGLGEIDKYVSDELITKIICPYCINENDNKLEKLQKENEQLKASVIKEREAKDFELLINRALTIKNKELLFEVKELKLSLEKAEKEIISRGDNFNRVKKENEILRLVVEKLKKSNDIISMYSRINNDNPRHYGEVVNETQKEVEELLKQTDSDELKWKTLEERKN